MFTLCVQVARMLYDEFSSPLAHPLRAILVAFAHKSRLEFLSTLPPSATFPEKSPRKIHEISLTMRRIRGKGNS
jgi:hypothetical protein